MNDDNDNTFNVRSFSPSPGDSDSNSRSNRGNKGNRGNRGNRGNNAAAADEALSHDGRGEEQRGEVGGVWRGALALFVVGVLIMIVSLSMVTYIAVANPYPEPDHCKAGRNMTVLNDLQGGE